MSHEMTIHITENLPQIAKEGTKKENFTIRYVILKTPILNINSYC